MNDIKTIIHLTPSGYGVIFRVNWSCIYFKC